MKDRKPQTTPPNQSDGTQGGEKEENKKGKVGENVLVPPPNDPEFYEWMDMYEKLHNLVKCLFFLP